MINFNKVKFIKSAPSIEEKPLDNFPEVLFVGRSNVGKSSLINSLINQKLAFVSSKPGHTKLLNYYLIDNKFYLVDAPGYGYTKSGNKYDDSFSKMMENYFENVNLKLVIFIVDSRHEPTDDDKDFFEFISQSEIPYLIIASKCDKLNQSGKYKIQKNLSTAFEAMNPKSVIYTSIKDQDSLNFLKAEIAKVL